MPAPTQPSFTQPATPGQLSNTRGSNTGADKIQFVAKYVNSTASDKAGTARITAYRTVSGGTPESSEFVWDSGWFGNPTVTPVPSLDGGNSHGATFVYNGRVYASSGNNNGQVISAPITGGSVGSWRQEASPPYAIAPGYGAISYIISMTQVNGYAYANVTYSGNVTCLFYSQINQDGTLGSWFSITATYQNLKTGQIIGLALSTGNYLLFIGGNQFNGAVATVTAYQLAADGSLTNTTGVAQAVLPAARTRHSIGYDAVNGNLWVVGGDDGTTAATTSWRAAIGSSFTVNGIVPSWTSDGTLPAARTGGALVVMPTVYPPASPVLFWYIGGASTPANASAVSTIYYAAGGVGTGTGLTWATNATALPTARWMLGGAQADSPEYSSGSNFLAPPLVVNGGISTAGTLLTTVTTLFVPVSASPYTLVSQEGTPAALATSNMGTNGSVVTNTDGSQAITFCFLGPGGPSAARFSGGFLDGDQVQFSIQFTDNTAGVPSPIGYTVVKIGQAPTITATSPANASTPAGAFTATFSYVGGAGGGAEASFRVQEQQPNGTTIADSGTVQGSANSFATRAALALANTPIPSNGQTGAVVFTVTSADTPMPGSSNTATVTSTTTYTGSAPGTPSAVTAVADNINGLVTVGWTSGVNTATNRIWYRLTGSSTWLLAKDNVTSTGSAQTLQVMEPLALGVTYDFSVSGASADPVEGARSTAVTGVSIIPNGSALNNQFDTGGYHAMLSVAGNGPAQHAGIFLNDGKVGIERKQASEVAQLFGATAPSVRYGIYNYRTITINLIQRLQDIAGMEAVLGATIASGATLCYRDIFNGAVIYCYLPEPRKYVDDLFQELSLTLVETAYTFVP